VDISLEVNPSKRAYSIQTQSTVKQAEKTSTTTRTDRLALSRQAVAYLEENNRRIQEQAQEKSEQEDDGDVTSDGGASDILDTLGKAMKEMEKCAKIAASIMKGKRVPLEDLRYLMEHDIKGYQLAMAMRKPEKDDKEEKSVLDDEDRNGNTTESSSSTEAPASCDTSGESAETATSGETSTSTEAAVSAEAV
jgi:hypothetical protein